MDIRYQVFISSTFADLQEERSRVIQTVMELDCIPAGMEIFPAIDEEQFNFIKKVIDDCDYYILIIGGRYGSVTEDGVSYTEKEYDYAIEKGIKVLAFIHEKPEEISLGKSETSPSGRVKLDQFRQKVAKDRLVRFWTNAKELPGLVALSLPKTIKTYPAIGWIRANSITNPETLQELNAQRKENSELKTLVDELSISNIAKNYNIADLEDTLTIFGIGLTIESKWVNWQLDVTWGRIFYILSPYLTPLKKDREIKDLLEENLQATILANNHNIHRVASLDDDLFETIKIQFKALGLVYFEYYNPSFYWYLTEKGEATMVELRTLKKK